MHSVLPPQEELLSPPVSLHPGDVGIAPQFIKLQIVYCPMILIRLLVLPISPKKIVIVPVVMSHVQVAQIEFHQHFVATRDQHPREVAIVKIIRVNVVIMEDADRGDHAGLETVRAYNAVNVLVMEVRQILKAETPYLMVL